MKVKGILQKAWKVLAISAMLISDLPNGLLTIAHAESGPSDGQVEYVGGLNSTSADSVYEIHTSKTIEAVDGKENYFDITLSTRTRRHKIDMSTDVVIVLDVSNTMNSDKDGNTSGVSTTATKLYQAKAATNTFISKFATNTNLDANRKIAVVTFNTNAQVAVPLTECNDYNDFDNPSSTNDIYAKVNAITAPVGNDVRFTNIEAGLMLARNVLSQSTAKFKYIVLLTDGFPTTYVTASADKTNTSSIPGYDVFMEKYYSSYSESTAASAPDGYFANTRSKELCSWGTSYSDKAAKKAQAMAASIKGSGINIFSVGIALNSQSIQNMATYIVDTTGMGASDPYVIGDNETSYKNWLENSIAGGPLLNSSSNRYSDGYNQAQLETDYARIMTDIERAPEVTMREFYTLDPMSDVIDFISFYDKDGNLASNPNSLTGQSKENAEDTASFNSGKINWNMLQSGYTMDGEYLVFDLTYRVRLKNESSGFKWSTAYDTNKRTTLNYSQKYVESGADVPGGTGSLDYQIPEVEGYYGKLDFKKIDKSNGAPIEGIPFTLKHNAENCSVCEGDALIGDFTAVSDANGAVSFTDIPSGHEYELIEADTMAYAPIHNHQIIVSYGETYVGSKTAENKLVDGKYPNGTEFVIENTKTEPVELVIQAYKTLNGSQPAAGQFSFVLDGNAPKGTVHETVKNDAEGYINFSKLVFDHTGTYTLTVSEVTGSDSTIIYDKDQHVIVVEVEKNASGLNFIANVSVDGGPAAAYTGTENVIETIFAGEFDNTDRAGTSVELSALKEYADGTLTAGAFTFELADEHGNVIETVKNAADGTVSFSKIDYSTAGVYRYTIKEVKGTDSDIVYDSSVYHVTVTVSAPADLTDAAALNAVVEITKDGNKVDSAKFVNADRKPASLILSASKLFNGVLPAKDAYEFELIQIDALGNKTVLETVKNDADGKVLFTEITYEDIVEKGSESAADYIYHIKEVKGTDSSVKYDEDYYIVSVHLTDEHADSYYLDVYVSKMENGTVKYVGNKQGVHVELGSSSEFNFEFVNTSEVKLDLSAVKTLNGAAPSGQTFEFVLVNEDGDIIETVHSDTNGNISFSTLTFTYEDAGDHIFAVYENPGSDATLYYDESVYTAEVTVSMDSNGNLSISKPVYKLDDSIVDAMKFDNKTKDPTHLHLHAIKTVNGQIPNSHQIFSFELKDEHGNVLQTKKNTANHVIFDEIVFDKEGTYIYTVSEKAGTVPGITDYDATVYTVTAEVFIKAGTDHVLDKTVTIKKGTLPGFLLR